MVLRPLAALTLLLGGGLVARPAAASPAAPLIAAAPDPCAEMNWHAERGLIDRDDVEALLARFDCRPPHYPRLAVELAVGRAGCDDIDWAARTEAITFAQWAALLDRYPRCVPPPASPAEVARAAAAAGDYRTVVVLAARANGVPEAAFLAVAVCESGLDPAARNPSGAAGLLQILSVYWPARAAAAGFPGASPFDPVANAWTGAWLWATSGPQNWAACL